jgi:hypothetical protein
MEEAWIETGVGAAGPDLVPRYMGFRMSMQQQRRTGAFAQSVDRRAAV